MVKKRKNIESLSAQEAIELWESGKKAELEPIKKVKRMGLFTLRLDYESIDDISRIAESEGVGPSVVARDLIHEALEHRREQRFERSSQDAMTQFLACHYLSHVLHSKPAGSVFDFWLSERAPSWGLNAFVITETSRSGESEATEPQFTELISFGGR